MAGESGRFRYRKRFGQHFLINGHIADRIVESASLGSEDTVLEIGPGKGILTERIIRKVRAVYAVEIDRDLAEMLRERFGKEEKFHLVEHDILKLDLNELIRGVSPRIKVVSNIPYYISSPIIELLINNRTIVSDAVLMVQKEVARRLLAEPGSKDYGLTTLNLALCAEGSKLMDVKPGSFKPPPEVMSSVISLVFNEKYRFPIANKHIFHIITGVAFRQRRKMVRNTLIPYFVSQGVTESAAMNLLLSAGISPFVRPETITTDSFVKLSNAFAEIQTSGYGPETRQ